MDGSAIKALRARLNLTQAQLAQLLGVHPITVSRWENNDPQHRPTAYQIGMMQSFETAADKDNEIPKILVGILITAGVIAAVALLLTAAFKSVTKSSA